MATGVFHGAGANTWRVTHTRLKSSRGPRQAVGTGHGTAPESRRCPDGRRARFARRRRVRPLEGQRTDGFPARRGALSPRAGSRKATSSTQDTVTQSKTALRKNNSTTSS
jgi:hypothetical protein